MKKTLEWTGPISVENISAFFTALCDVVCAGADIEVNLRECAAIDLSCLQVLCAGQRKARSLDATLHLGPSAHAAVKTAAAENSFFRRNPCCAECGSSCLWLAGDSPV
ncbi:MAG: STAS domain-containing protein [Desulfuromonadales bacterium]